MQDTTDIIKLSTEQLNISLSDLSPSWELSEDGKTIDREFTFKGYYKTIAFVNVLAWLAQEEKHHPDLEVSFGRVLVKLTTHDIDGLSTKDISLAQKIDSI